MPVEMRAVHLPELMVRELAGQVETDDLGAQGRRQLADEEGVGWALRWQALGGGSEGHGAVSGEAAL